MFALDVFDELMKDDRVAKYALAGCRYGADAEKPTDLLSNYDLSELELQCNHPAVR